MTKHKTPPPSPTKSKFLCGIPQTDFISVVASILLEISSKNNSKAHFQKNSSFACELAPNITFEQYLSRVIKYSNCSPEVFICSLIYIDRITQLNQDFYVTSYNIHRIFITCVMVATKFFDDYFQSNQYFSKIGGIELKEMNRLEVELMKLIQYEFFISKDLFDCYLEEIKVLSENF
eukprot:gene12211-5798_t